MSKKVSAEQFVKTWLEAKLQDQNASWVAQQLGISRQAVIARAGRMRARGHDLPELPSYFEGEETRAGELLKRAKT
jgi:hypothetical protein